MWAPVGQQRAPTEQVGLGVPIPALKEGFSQIGLVEGGGPVRGPSLLVVLNEEIGRFLEGQPHPIPPLFLLGSIFLSAGSCLGLLAWGLGRTSSPGERRPWWSRPRGGLAPPGWVLVDSSPS